MTFENSKQQPNAVLISVIFPGMTDEENLDSLNELGRLVQTLGYNVLTTLSQRRSGVSSHSVLGEGKLKELAALTGGTGVVKSPSFHKKTKASQKFEQEEQEDISSISIEMEHEDTLEQRNEPLQKTAQIVIFDGELTPSQLANLQSATGAEVLDRTGVIVEIFSRHAKTRESKLQVEIARLKYLAPRVRETGPKEDDRIAGKTGETKLELDRRKIRDRISELRHELLSVQKDHSARQMRRQDQFRVALVGYTNAGKSSLMRALTGSQVLVEDKLFATLDTTVRTLYPESRPKILISDTVGFIKKLPHDLVASFRSTLEEAAQASLLLFVVDASDKSFRSQLEVTQNVLNEIGVQDIPKKLILNKIDKISDERKFELIQEFPDALFISTKNPEDIQNLRSFFIEFFESDMIETEIYVSYQTQGVIGEIRANVRILLESYDENGVSLKIRAPQSYLNKLKKILDLKS